MLDYWNIWASLQMKNATCCVTNCLPCILHVGYRYTSYKMALTVWSTLLSKPITLLTLKKSVSIFNPLNAELNPICYQLALLEAHHILHVSGVRVNIIPTIFAFLLSHYSLTTTWTLRKIFEYQKYVEGSTINVQSSNNLT